jgi:hypothetical protein
LRRAIGNAAWLPMLVKDSVNTKALPIVANQVKGAGASCGDANVPQKWRAFPGFSAFAAAGIRSRESAGCRLRLIRANIRLKQLWARSWC